MSVICFGWFVFLLLLVSIQTDGRVITVPIEAHTIQAALDSLQSGDTVIVLNGVYEEVLIAPAIPFTMQGEQVGDSSEFAQPVVEASNLALPDSFAVLFLPEGSRATLNGVTFRNEGRAGVISYGGNTTITSCRFENVADGFHYRRNGTDVEIEVSDCEFLGISQRALLAVQGACLSVRNCRFVASGQTDLSFMLSSCSHFVSCRFESIGERTLLAGVDGRHEITNCEFGPVSTLPSREIVYLSGSEISFTNNIFRDCHYGYHTIYVASAQGDSVRITGNMFNGCVGIDIGQAAQGVIGLLITGVQGLGPLIEGNLFEHCSGAFAVDDIACSINSPAQIMANTFADELPNSLPSISAGNWWQPAPAVLHNNIFENCGYALDGSPETDARFNYWGDASGPYHETDNPSGLGDTITGPVQFIPWLTDTMSSVDDVVALPESIALTVYPNPFNATTTLYFELKQGARSVVVMYDLLGREVWRSAEEVRTIGSHRIEFDAHNLASGIYFAKLVTPQHTSVTKAVLIR